MAQGVVRSGNHGLQIPISPSGAIEGPPPATTPIREMRGMRIDPTVLDTFFRIEAAILCIAATSNDAEDVGGPQVPSADHAGDASRVENLSPVTNLTSRAQAMGVAAVDASFPTNESTGRRKNTPMAQAHPSHVWLPRYTARLLKLVPGLTSHRAVEFALSAFPDTADLEPETAAEIFAISHAQSKHSSASSWLRNRFALSSGQTPLD